MDIKRAYDTVSHSHALEGMYSLGIRGRALRWIYDYLHGRSVFMRTQDGACHDHHLPCGVPQGGVLSPLLFSVVLAALPQLLPKNVHISIYANDICLWTSGVQMPALQRRIQNALDVTERFFTERGMDISSEKTVFLPFTRKKVKTFQLTLNTQRIKRVSHHRFLGVIIDNQLSWVAHVKYVKARANARSNVLRYTAGSRWGMSTTSLLALHRALIRQMIAYHLPVLHGVSDTSERTLQTALVRSLKICLGVPCATSNALTIAEARELSIDALKTQESVRHIARLETAHSKHPLARKLVRRRSQFSSAIAPYRSAIPKLQLWQTVLHPPWTFMVPKVRTHVPSVQKKASHPAPAVKQHCLMMMEEYRNRTAIFTDGSSKASGSASAFVVPQHSLSHQTLQLSWWR